MTDLIAVLLVLSLLSSCKYEEVRLYQPNEENRTVAGFISNNFDFTLLNAALERTGLLDTLNNELGRYTLLAPPNSAFEAIGISKPADFAQLDQDSLREALAFHIIPQRLLMEDVPWDNGVQYRSLAGMDHEASKIKYVQTTYLTFSGSRVVQADQAFINGNVQVLDKVIKYYPKGTIKDWLEGSDRYRIFTEGLRHFGLLDQLGDTDKRFTVFAPDNEEFQSRSITASTIKRMDVNDYVGARLFGAYILPDMRLYISEFRYAYCYSGQQYMTRPLKDDEGYYQNLSGTSRDYPGANIFPYQVLDENYYSFGIAKVAYPYGNYKDKTKNDDFDLFLGSGPQDDQAPTYGDRPVRHDYITSNGNIHDIHALLVLPREAKRN